MSLVMCLQLQNLRGMGVKINSYSGNKDNNNNNNKAFIRNLSGDLRQDGSFHLLSGIISRPAASFTSS